MNRTQPETLFGVSRSLHHLEARALEAYLVAAWIAQTRKLPAALENDLAVLARFFAPTSTSRRLRACLAELGRVTTSRPSSLPAELYLASPNGRGLVTPEGRVILHLLEQHHDSKQVRFHLKEVAWAYKTVADLYRFWGRDRLVEALGIKENPLRLPVVGFNLALQINGSVGEDKAFPIPAGESEGDELSGILGPVLDAFVESLQPRRKRKEAFRLRGGWILTETSRHLSDSVTFTTKAIWILPNRQKPLVDRLARELARDKGRTRGDVQRAFDALLAAYAKARPALAARAIAHERSAQTRVLREQLLAAFGEASAS